MFLAPKPSEPLSDNVGYTTVRSTMILLSLKQGCLALFPIPAPFLCLKYLLTVTCGGKGQDRARLRPLEAINT